jgi:hypothetical protein
VAFEKNEVENCMWGALLVVAPRFLILAKAEKFNSERLQIRKEWTTLRKSAFDLFYVLKEIFFNKEKN